MWVLGKNSYKIFKEIIKYEIELIKIIDSKK